jgi:hypothetical protein
MIHNKIFLSCILIIAFFVFNLSSGECGKFLEKHRTDKGVEFISGGVGISERNAMEELEKDYNLKLVFAHITGKYLSGITVRIQDSMGNLLLSTTTDGPWLLVRLPVGEVKITAIYKGMSQKRDVKIVVGVKKIFFHWKGKK